MTFYVGQQVFDLRYGWGVVVKTADRNYVLPLVVKFIVNRQDIYESDGKNSKNDFAPSLLTVEQAKLLGYEPPKKKVKKEIRGWVNVYHLAASHEFYKHKTDADFHAYKDRIACVECVGTYEVEE